MAELPAQPVAPAEFFESLLPRAFVAWGLSGGLSGVEAHLGVVLTGAGGGEWKLRMAGGALIVEAGSRDGAWLTLVQSVEDWRGALWGGRGAAIGRRAAALFRTGDPSGLLPAGVAAELAHLALERLRQLDGLVRVVVREADRGDWCVAVKLGPGPVPERPTTTLEMSGEDLDAMESGALDPVEAFMAGRIQVLGDVALVMQVQAIRMQCAPPAPAAPEH